MHKCVFTLLALLCLAGTALAQSSCQCDFIITQSGQYFGDRMNVKPGQTICVKAGHYEYLRFRNFTGAEGAPIRIINYGGQVTIGVEAYYSGVQFWNSKFFRFTGSGDSNYQYGFKVTRTSSYVSSINVTSLSTNCEIDGVEVAAAGFAGIMVKSDPDCDPEAWRDNFAMRDVKIHDNYIHDTSAEGMYIGSTSYSGKWLTCNGVNTVVYPHNIYGLDVYNNRVERTGAEGIQVACAPEAKVHHNTIGSAGWDPFEPYQNNGLQIGGGAGGDYYGNIIQNVNGAGFVVIGHLGNCKIYNNVVQHVGQDGIFCDEREGSLAGTYMIFANNTITDSGRDAIRLYNEMNVNTVVNNVLSNYGTKESSWGYPGKPITFQQGATATMANNYTAISTTPARFVNAPAGDFHIMAGSALIDAGRDVTTYGITADADGSQRVAGSATDIGAYEFKNTVSEAGDTTFAAAVGYRNMAGSARTLAAGSEKLSLTLNNAKPNSPCGGGAMFEMRPVGDPSQETTAQKGKPFVNVYPTPCLTDATLELSEARAVMMVEVVSANGQVILTKRFSGINQTFPLATQSLPKGVYTVRLFTDEGILTSRLVRQ